MGFLHALGLHKAMRPFDRVVRPILNFRADQRLEQCWNVQDLRKAAQARMHPMCFGYLDSGADDELALERSTSAFDDLELHYRNLSGLERPISTATKFVGGEAIGLPFFPAPCAGHRMFHTEGEVATATVAAERQVPFCLSTFATCSFEQVAAAQLAVSSASTAAASSTAVASSSTAGTAAVTPRVFQLYVLRERELVSGLLERAAASGFRHVALTVDLTWFGNRERDKRTGFTVPPTYSPRQVAGALARPAWAWDFAATEEYRYALMAPDVAAESIASFINAKIDPRFDWDDGKWLCEEWPRIVARADETTAKAAATAAAAAAEAGNAGAAPSTTAAGIADAAEPLPPPPPPPPSVLLKGVVRADEAARAVREAGFGGVWVSNHGGRQLETAPPTIDVLPSIREAMGPEAFLVLDGGVRRGHHVAKAVALGADAVAVGRPYLFVVLHTTHHLL